MNTLRHLTFKKYFSGCVPSLLCHVVTNVVLLNTAEDNLVVAWTKCLLQGLLPCPMILCSAKAHLN